MSITVEGVQVRLGRDPDDVRKYNINVAVYSKVRPGLKANSAIDPGTAANVKHVIYLISAAAGSCCEYLGEKYGDNIDPDSAARLALQAWQEECHLQKALQQTGPEKLKLLEAHAAELPAHEWELLSLLRWLLKHGQDLTPVEGEWIDQRLRDLRQSQFDSDELEEPEDDDQVPIQEPKQ